MKTDFKVLMASKTDAELQSYIENRSKFVTIVVKEAINELQKRGHIFSEDELQTFRNEFVQRAETFKCKQKKRRIVSGIWVLVGIFVIYCSARWIAPGSYPFAEVYELNVPEQEVIKAIDEFKLENPDYVVPPKVTINHKYAGDINESGGRKENSYWYFVYFYYPQENQILCTWTRPAGKNKTDFAFVSINEGLDLGHWKDINDDYWFFENRKKKKQFEERILSKIEAKLIEK